MAQVAYANGFISAKLIYLIIIFTNFQNKKKTDLSNDQSILRALLGNAPATVATVMLSQPHTKLFIRDLTLFRFGPGWLHLDLIQYAILESLGRHLQIEDSQAFTVWHRQDGAKPSQGNAQTRVAI